MFRNNKKEIVFRGSNKNSELLFSKPKPGHAYSPDWFKRDKNYANGSNNVVRAIKEEGAETTYKMCVPLTDSITAGYIIPLPATVVVVNNGDKNNYAPMVRWNVDWNVCDTIPISNYQGPESYNKALQSYPVPDNHNNMIFRWNVDWNIITPKGYSSWITHPSHRYDLPFTTLTGFVDTDVHPNHLLLPFFIKNGFEGVIEEGTPIAQIIPVKREIWNSKEEPFDKDMPSHANSVKIDYIRGYKKRYWSRKIYK